MENRLQVFEDQQIRSVWDEEQEEWFFSVVDVVGVLTDSPNPRKYWSVLKTRLKKEGGQLTTICSQLKMKSADGKYYKTDAAPIEQLFRIIQSIPSPKAEPVKRWLAQVGAERIQETIDPEQAIERAKATYLAKGYSPEWANQRALSIQVRQELTDEWKARGVEANQYAILTDIMHKTWTGMKVKEHKQLKGLKKENLRDNMTTMELILTMLAEQTTTEISRNKAPQTLQEHTETARAGGTVARNARLEVEKRTKRKVISSQNAKDLLLEGKKKP